MVLPIGGRVALCGLLVGVAFHVAVVGGLGGHDLAAALDGAFEFVLDGLLLDWIGGGGLVREGGGREGVGAEEGKLGGEIVFLRGGTGTSYLRWAKIANFCWHYWKIKFKSFSRKPPGHTLQSMFAHLSSSLKSIQYTTNYY